MAVYMVAYDLHNASSQNYQTVHATIESFGAWCKVLESTYLVATTYNAESMSNTLQSLNIVNRHLVIKIQPTSDRQGWLSQEQWNWINARL